LRIRPLLAPILLYAASRAAVFFAARAATWYEKRLTFETALSGWDAGWFLRIAKFGYPNSLAEEPGGGNRWAYFPGLPLIIRAVARTTGLSYEASGILCSFVIGLLATIVIWKLVEGRFDASTATKTVALLVFFPSAYVLSMSYSDGLFILASALCLILIDRQRWTWAGLAASLGCLARLWGVVLVAVCVVEAGKAVYRTRDWRPLLAVVTAPLGLVGWVGFQWVRVGDPLAFNTAYAYWGNEWVWFTTPFRSAWRLATSTAAWHSAPDVMATVGLIVILAGLSLLFRAQRRLRVVPAGWWVYAIGTALLAFSNSWPTGILRYTLAVFPAFIGIAWHLRREWVSPLVATLATMQGAIAVVAFASIITWQTAPFAP
jgi:hypothetical protein